MVLQDRHVGLGRADTLVWEGQTRWSGKGRHVGLGRADTLVWQGRHVGLGRADTLVCPYDCFLEASVIFVGRVSRHGSGFIGTEVYER